MADKKFSIKEAITYGWETVKANLGFLLAFVIVAALIQYIPALFAQWTQKSAPPLAFILKFVSWLMQMIISMGFIRMGLKFYEGGKGEWSDLYSSYPKLLNYIVASLLYGLIVFAGTLLLIVPGIIWAIKFQFFGFFIVDKNLGPIEALKKSSELSKGNISHLFLFGLAITGVSLLGLLCFIVGLFVAIPVVLMASVFIYRKLDSQMGTVPVA